MRHEGSRARVFGTSLGSLERRLRRFVFLILHLGRRVRHRCRRAEVVGIIICGLDDHDGGFKDAGAFPARRASVPAVPALGAPEIDASLVDGGDGERWRLAASLLSAGPGRRLGRLSRRPAGGSGDVQSLLGVQHRLDRFVCGPVGDVAESLALGRRLDLGTVLALALALAGAVLAVRGCRSSVREPPGALVEGHVLLVAVIVADECARHVRRPYLHAPRACLDDGAPDVLAVGRRGRALLAPAAWFGKAEPLLDASADPPIRDGFSLSLRRELILIHILLFFLFLFFLILLFLFFIRSLSLVLGLGDVLCRFEDRAGVHRGAPRGVQLLGLGEVKLVRVRLLRHRSRHPTRHPSAPHGTHLGTLLPLVVVFVENVHLVELGRGLGGHDGLRGRLLVPVAVAVVLDGGRRLGGHDGLRLGRHRARSRHRLRSRVLHGDRVGGRGGFRSLLLSLPLRLQLTPVLLIHE